MDPNNIDSLYYNYSRHILKEIKDLRTTGKIGFYPRNKYMYIKTQNKYNLKAFNILNNAGFQLPQNWNKSARPKSHISLVNGFEQDRLLCRDDAYRIYQKYKNVDVEFQIDEVQFNLQWDRKTERSKIVCILTITSKMIADIRSEMKLEESPYFKQHI